MALLTGFQAPSVKKAKLYFKRHRDASGPQPPSTGGRAGTGRASAADPAAEGTAAPANDVRKARAAALLRAGWGGRPPGHLHDLWHLVAQAAEQQWDELGEEGVAVPQVQQPAPHHARHRPADLCAKGAQRVCGQRWRPGGVSQERSGPGPALGAGLGRPHLRPAASSPASLRHEAAWRVCDVLCGDPRQAGRWQRAGATPPRGTPAAGCLRR